MLDFEWHNAFSKARVSHDALESTRVDISPKSRSESPAKCARWSATGTDGSRPKITCNWILWEL